MMSINLPNIDKTRKRHLTIRIFKYYEKQEDKQSKEGTQTEQNNQNKFSNNINECYHQPNTVMGIKCNKYMLSKNKCK